MEGHHLALLQQQIIREMELDLVIPTIPSDEQIMSERFGLIFPPTRIMSQFARENVEVDISRPDETLLRWLEREEQLFRALEAVIVKQRLDQNFATVDAFMEYSLSVQNRRKSRMGYSLQNHLAELFHCHNLRFTAQARTESNNRPDFIFPGESEYHDGDFPESLLIMLGVKSTSKDRWRQVLTEADRIPNKHLCTLETGISVRQTEEMQRQNLTLVIPESLQATYTKIQQSKLWSLRKFINFVSNNRCTGIY